MHIISWDVGIRNMTYCLLDENIIIQWANIDILEGTNIDILEGTNKLTFYEQNKLLVEKLDKIDNILNVDYVLIENQPGFKNPIMKTIQMILYTYYLIRDAIDSPRIKEIILINPTNKLKVYKGPPIKCMHTNKYRRNKYLAIEHCKYMLKDFPDELQFLIESNKKDDLADSYLQGMYFFHNKFKYLNINR